MEPTEPQPLFEIDPKGLLVGMTMRFTLRDETGRVLLAKGLKIISGQALASLKARRSVYVEANESDEALRSLMVSLTEVSQREAPLRELNWGSAAPSGGRRESLTGEVNVMCDTLEAKLQAVLSRISHGVESRSGSALECLAVVVENLKQVLAQDTDAALLFLIHRPLQGYAGYSVLHSLQCAALVILVGAKLGLSEEETDVLCHAALTMNVGMTALQDILAGQKGKLTDAQRQDVANHGAQGASLLQTAGIDNELWLDVVRRHHAELPRTAPLAARPVGDRLNQVLQVLDKYTASLCVRASRPGQAAAVAARAAISPRGSAGVDEVGLALVSVLGMYPPGTFVKLENGHTALVLRKGLKATAPIVISVLNHHHVLTPEVKLYNTAAPGHAVREGVVGSEVKARVNVDLIVKRLAASRNVPVSASV